MYNGWLWKHQGLRRSIRKLLCHFFANPKLSEVFSHRWSQCLFQGRNLPCNALSLHNHFSIYLEIFLCMCQIKWQCASFQSFAYPPLSHPCKSKQDISNSDLYERKKKIFSKSLNKILWMCGSGSFLEITCKVWSKIIAWSYSKFCIM